MKWIRVTLSKILIERMPEKMREVIRQRGKQTKYQLAISMYSSLSRRQNITNIP